MVVLNYHIIIMTNVLTTENPLYARKNFEKSVQKTAQEIIAALLDQENSENKKNKVQKKEKELSYPEAKERVNILLQVREIIEQNERLASDLQEDALGSVDDELKQL